ncbi:hypothetical protein BXZ70DRAFT_954360 [Cristinia sonorae]|uniref:Yippee domain-containing protein n=1 Tax=Cristinia sonorae TaxID=1940300 RepID=A0A8K0XLF8_9AGAR|nr:hypothetical protein BXZ70DRAFT_954360 [Cristinia sonorae]
MDSLYGLPMSRILPRKRSMPNLTGESSRPRGTLACKKCQTRIASKRSVLSWSFRGNLGKAALFTKVANVTLHKPTVLLMDSGAHTVQEFSCMRCATILGWTIVRAHEWPEKWKEGYSVLELGLLDEIDGPSPTPSIVVQQVATPQEEVAEPKVAAFQAYLQVASALSKGRRRVSSEMERARPSGPRAITPTPGTPPRQSMLRVQ